MKPDKIDILTSDDKRAIDMAMKISEAIDTSGRDMALISYVALKMVSQGVLELLESNGVRLANEGFVDRKPGKEMN